MSPWSAANLYNGNLLTEIVLTEFGPVGPGVRFALYHNAASAGGGGGQISAPGGFSLGAGWITSYGGGIIDNGDGTVTLLEDDGNEYLFTLTNGIYVPIAGVHEHLVFDSQTNQWVLTRTNQWQRVYNDAGRLIEVRDAAGRTLTVQRDAGQNDRISAIQAPLGPGESSPQTLTFSYDPNTGQLASIAGPSSDPNNPGSPQWTFDYDASGRLATLHLPGGKSLAFSYNSADRIRTITDETGAAWDYRYAGGPTLTKVMDPPDPNTGLRAEQLISYSSTPVSGNWETYYTARDLSVWTYAFDSDGQFLRLTDPDADTVDLTYDADRNVTTLTDAWGVTLSATWGPDATLATLHLPAARREDDPNWNTTTLIWDQPDPTGRPNFWRLVQTADQTGTSTLAAYDDANDPTKATGLTETDPNASQKSWGGNILPFPTTGFGSFRQYWDVGATGGAGAPIGRHFEPIDPPAPGTGLPQQEQSMPRYGWRWRFYWVVPPFGAHIGIDYHWYSGGDLVFHYDYGQAPDNMNGQCPASCCKPGNWKGVNNRYPEENDSTACPGQDGRISGGVGRTLSDTDWRVAMTNWVEGSDVLRSCWRWQTSPTWTDSSGDCCRYYWNGWTPYWLTGNYSNSNGGLHAAMHNCQGNAHAWPPGCWLHFTPGWSNNELVGLDTHCAGFRYDNPCGD